MKLLGQRQGLLDRPRPILSLFQHYVSHVRAAEMKLKQNNLVDVRLKFFQFYLSFILHVRPA